MANALKHEEVSIQRVDPRLLRCPADFNHELNEIENGLICNSCQQNYPIVNNRVIFFKYPADAYVRGIKPKSVWTNFRKANFEYFVDNLKHASRNQTLLDVGSGPSDFRELTSQFHYIGMDLVPYELVNVVTDFNKLLPFKNDFCDIVFMSNVLEHIPDPTLLLKECYRILRPGGLLLGCTALLQEVHQIPYDFLRYTNFMLEKLLTDLGFKNSKATSLGTPLDTYTAMQRQFFEIVSTTRFCENRYKNYILRKTTAALEKCSSKALSLLNPVLGSIGPSNVFTEGYGYRGEK